MLWGNRKTGPKAPKRGKTSFRPLALDLEPRVLLTLTQPVDLINIDGSQPNAVPVGPFGMLEAGTKTESGFGAGFSVANAGDVNRDGFDDILVGAPTVTTDANGFPVLNGGPGRAYLIFGSRSATTKSVSDWLNATPTNGNTIPVDPSPTATNAVYNIRDGDLSQLGNATQTNPVTNITTGSTQTPTFPFAGITIYNSAANMKNAELGAAVAGVGDINGDGYADFMIGAPGASTAYLIYGSPALASLTTPQLDLSTPNTTIVNTFIGPANSGAGRSLANTYDFIQDGNLGDLAIGAPNASVSSANSGAVYIVSGGEVNSATAVSRTFQLSQLNITNTGGVTSPIGTIIAGANTGDRLGFSVAGLGDIVSSKSSSQDILIGAPAQGNLTTGAAYLLYAATPTSIRNYAGTNNFLSVQNLGDPSAGATVIPGAGFFGINPGDYTGYSVAGIGDFNGDGIPDFAIGSPGYDLGTTAATTSFDGRVDVFFATNPSGGKDQNPRYGAFLVSDAETSTPNTGVGFAASASQAFGFSIAGTGSLNTISNNELLIGAPNTLAGANGTVYLVAGGSALPATNSLAAGISTSGPLVYYSFFESQSATRDLFGTSVAGLKFLNNSSYFDGDGVPDFLIGSAGLNVNAQSPLAGGTYIMENGLNVYRIATPSGSVNPPPPPPPSGGTAGVSNRISLLNTSAVPLFGGALLPTPSTLSRLRWKPLPPRVAYNQFLPSRAFLQRNRQFFHPVQQKPHGSKKVDGSYRTSTLGQRVFTRGKFPPGVHFGVIRHRGPTIPRTA